MGLLDFFKRGKPPQSSQVESFESFSARLLDEFSRNDFLGQAAAAKDKARSAKATGDHDAAWRFYQEVKEHYLRHAARCKFTKAQTLALDASVSEHLADILRLEGKHHDALVHILYWVASTDRPTKTQQQKLSAYFNRCKFQGVGTSNLKQMVESCCAEPDFVRIRAVVADWREKF